MAQPQGLNIPSIIVTGVVTVIVLHTIVEGVRAYYLRAVNVEEEQKWSQGSQPLVVGLRKEQLPKMESGPMPIAAAMKAIVGNKGNLPATQPAAQ
ncbi:MAG TPA: hypothetical protein VGB55_15850 [Tepidisphaeraceae bacterium]|jgi:hypothetical protein